MKIPTSTIATVVIAATAIGGTALAISARNNVVDVKTSPSTQRLSDPSLSDVTVLDTQRPTGSIENETPKLLPTNPESSPTPTASSTPQPTSPERIASGVTPTKPPNFGGSDDEDVQTDDGEYNDDSDSNYGSDDDGNSDSDSQDSEENDD